MADTRESVVLAQDGHRRSVARLDGGAEGGVDPAHALLDLEALLAQELRQPGAGLDFLVAQLGIGVDLLGKGLQLVGAAVHGLRNGIFDGTHRGLRGVRFQIRSTDHSPKHSFVERR
jgi:hypothetical protein